MDSNNFRHLSREELDRELAKLSASARDYTAPPRESAMCYSMMPPEYIRHTFTCAACGKTGRARVCKMYGGDGEYDPVRAYDRLLDGYRSLGCRAELSEYCWKCVEHVDRLGRVIRDYPASVVVRIWISDDEEPLIYCPDPSEYRPRDLKLALEFLSGKRTVAELSEPNRFTHAFEQNSAENIIQSVRAVLCESDESQELADYLI